MGSRYKYIRDTDTLPVVVDDRLILHGTKNLHPIISNINEDDTQLVSADITTILGGLDVDKMNEISENSNSICSKKEEQLSGEITNKISNMNEFIIYNKVLTDQSHLDTSIGDEFSNKFMNNKMIDDFVNSLQITEQTTEITEIPIWKTIEAIQDNTIIRGNRTFVKPYNKGWRLRGDINKGRFIAASAGTDEKCLIFGGNNNGQIDSTEKLINGYWTNMQKLPTAVDGHGGCGTADFALSFGGSFNDSYESNSTFKYINDTWSTTSELTLNRTFLSGSGLVDAALAIGGFNNDNYIGLVEKYNGFTWSSIGEMPEVKRNHSSSGLINDTIVVGGYRGYAVDTVHHYNGDTWFAKASINIKNHSLSVSGNGTSAIYFGGFTRDAKSMSEGYDGEKWTLLDYMNIDRTYPVNGASNPKSILAISGDNNGILSTQCEQFTGNTNIVFSNPCVTLSAGEKLKIYRGTPISKPLWLMGNTPNYASYEHGTSGLLDCGLMAGGGSPTPTVNTSAYNGNTWQSENVMLTKRSLMSASGQFDSTIITGGYEFVSTNTSYIFNGNTWSTTENIPDNRVNHNSVGILDSTFLTAGSLDLSGVNKITTSYKFNGITWATKPELVIGKSKAGMVGTINDAYVIAGMNDDITDSVVKFDGEKWSMSKSINIPRMNLSSSGGGYSAVITSGTDSNDINTSSAESFDSEVWSVISSLNISRANAGSVGSGAKLGVVNGSTLPSFERYGNGLILDYDKTNIIINDMFANTELSHIILSNKAVKIISEV